jgi:hypothetical protein
VSHYQPPEPQQIVVELPHTPVAGGGESQLDIPAIMNQVLEINNTKYLKVIQDNLNRHDGQIGALTKRLAEVAALASERAAAPTSPKVASAGAQLPHSNRQKTLISQ